MNKFKVLGGAVLLLGLAGCSDLFGPGVGVGFSGIGQEPGSGLSTVSQPQAPAPAGAPNVVRISDPGAPKTAVEARARATATPVTYQISRTEWVTVVLTSGGLVQQTYQNCALAASASTCS